VYQEFIRLNPVEFDVEPFGCGCKGIHNSFFWIANNELQYLSEEIGALRDLKKLHFDSNFIKNFPGSLIGHEEISAEANLITEIPVSILTKR